MTSGSGRLVTISRSHSGVRSNSDAINPDSSFFPFTDASSSASINITISLVRRQECLKGLDDQVVK